MVIGGFLYIFFFCFLVVVVSGGLEGLRFFYVVFGMVCTFDAATTNRTPQQQLEGNQL